MDGSLIKYIFFRYRFIKHVLFWLVYIGLNTMMYGQVRSDYFTQFQLQLFYLPTDLYNSLLSAATFLIAETISEVH